MLRLWRACRGPLAIFGLLSLITIATDLASPLARTSSETKKTIIPYSDFLAEVAQNHVRAVTIGGTKMYATLADSKNLVTFIPPNIELATSLAAKSIAVTALPDDENPNPLLHLLLAWLPMALYFLATWLWIARPLMRLANAAEKNASS
jgi:ATP-dependent Zn protease